MIENDNNITYNTLFHWNNFKFKLIIEGVIVGIFTRFIVVLYRYLLEKSSYIINQVYNGLSQKY